MMEQLWTMVAKDLTCELRARRAWPAMCLLGIVLAFLFSLEFDLRAAEKLRIVAGFQWLTACFATVIMVGQSFALEREDGCWATLLHYPVSPVVLYLSKLLVNAISLALLQCILIPAIALWSNIPLATHLWQLAAVVLLGNLAMAAIATLVGGLGVASRERDNTAALLALPLLLPVVLAASAATRLALEASIGPAWWRWMQLLGAMAVIFVTAGTLLFEFVIEE